GALPPQTYGVDSIDAARSRIVWRSASDGSFDWGSAGAGAAGPCRTISDGAGTAGAFGPFGSARSESSDARTIGPSVAQSSSAVTARAASRRSVSRATKYRVKTWRPSYVRSSSTSKNPATGDASARAASSVKPFEADRSG